MAKRVQEVLECDVCGKEAERYIVIYPHEGQMILDRCAKHNGKLRALKEEQGLWMPRDGNRTPYKVSDPDELLRKYATKKNSLPG